MSWKRRKKSKHLRKNPFYENARKWLTRTLFIISMGGICSVTISVVYNAAFITDFFQMTSINVEGCRKTTEDQILEQSNIEMYPNLLAIDVEKVAVRIGELDWVERVDIKKKYPNRLHIAVVEREPTAMINLVEGLYYIDEKGVVFSKAHYSGNRDYPVITGLEKQVVVSNGEHSVSGSVNLLHENPLNEALKFIKYASITNVKTTLPRQDISQLHYSPKEGAILFLASHPFPIYLGGGDFSVQFKRLEKVLKSIYQKNEIAAVSYIRMQYRADAVLVGMGKKA